MKPVAIIQNCEVEAAGSIKDYFNKRKISFTETHSYRGEKLPNLSEVDAVISLGCPLSVTTYKEHQFLANLFDHTKLIIEEGKPFLGVCFGAQMLALALGAKVYPNKKKEIGVCELRLTGSGQKDPLFMGFKPTLEVFQWHGDTFDIPPGATNLAESTDCKNQAFRKGKLVGLQFHLEAEMAQVPIWCDTYADELAGEGKDKQEVLNSIKSKEEQMRPLSFRLLDNFFAL